MKITILYWNRREGKTTEIQKMMAEMGSLENVLLIVQSQVEARFFKDEIKRGLEVRTAGSQLRGMHPSRIFIENADFLKPKTLYNEIYPMTCADNCEIVMTISDQHGMELFTPRLRERHYILLKAIRVACTGIRKILHDLQKAIQDGGET